MNEQRNTDMTQEEIRLTEEIQNLENEVFSYFTQIGQEYFETCKDTPQSESMKACFAEVENRVARINECQEQIRGIRGITSCTNCGADINVNDTFCCNCGTRIISEATLSPYENQCPNCRSSVNPGQLFCTTCGLRLTVAAPSEYEESTIGRAKTDFFTPDSQEMRWENEKVTEPARTETSWSVTEELREPEPVPEPAQVMLFCTNCGADLMPGDLFCTKCGTRVPV